jgi:hypothetical protein
MADLDLIEAAIVSNLSRITALKKVYDHEPKSMPQLPAATLFFDGFSQSDEASRRKRVNWRWVIRFYVSLQDAEKAQNEAKNIVLNARKELSKDPTLGNNCIFQEIANGEIYVALDQNNPHLMGEMTLIAQVEENY